ncbi:MAG TPA: 2-oxo-4-hydroxy-4-carboxy-5-ureidoimidazoline decarboxylase [Candidatus Dormibacteraeota bacterium]|nr:2-oxo-4-hydroxy-4-carboxy-5-ureidoimidazoline decarboxylase [Candidatus Dormibacteraeota bacterium]
MNEFNRLPPDEAEERLYVCFASRKWARRLAAGRPYVDVDALLGAAGRVWSELEPSDWSEAYAGHPRIGERGGSSPAASESEQGGVRSARADTLAQLAEENRRYEAKFGRVFFISAQGKSAEEILAALRKRMDNDSETEAQIAATEHQKVAVLRLMSVARP